MSADKKLNLSVKKAIPISFHPIPQGGIPLSPAESGIKLKTNSSACNFLLSDEHQVNCI
jgi:hypothetical protein